MGATIAPAIDVDTARGARGHECPLDANLEAKFALEREDGSIDKRWQGGIAGGWHGMTLPHDRRSLPPRKSESNLRMGAIDEVSWK